MVVALASLRPGKKKRLVKRFRAEVAENAEKGKLA